MLPLVVAGLLLGKASAQDNLRRTAATACDPYFGCRYQRFSNGGPVASTTTPYSTWDLFEVAWYDGATKLTGVTAHSSVLPGRLGNPKELACDGDSATYWACEGTSDTDISAPVWTASKIGSNWIIFDLGAASRVTHFDVTQSATDLSWNVALLRLEYSTDMVSWSPAVNKAVGAGLTRITNQGPVITTTTQGVTLTETTITTSFDPDATTTTATTTTTTSSTTTSTTPSGDPFVAAGRHFSFVGENGVVRGAGRNNRGQLGIGSMTGEELNLTEVAFSGEAFIVDAAAGAFHSLFLSAYGEVFATGWNRFGQLALGDNDDRVTPTLIEGLDNVVAVSAGYAHSLFLKDDGTVWSAGLNSMGQLGDGTMENSNVLVQGGVTGCMSISAGYDFSLFLKANSEAWATGNGLGGQLGDATLRVSASPVRALTNVAAIAAGESHSLFLMNPADVHPHQQVVQATGANFDGQLGDGTRISKAGPVAINHFEDFNAMSAGGDSSCFSSGTALQLRCAGSNRDGQIGLAEEVFSLTPEQVTGAFGSVLKLSVGDTHSFFLHYDDPQGRVYSTGKNIFGELGDGTTEPQTTPKEVGTFEVTPTTRAPTPPPTQEPTPTSAPTPPSPGEATPAPTPVPTPEPSRDTNTEPFDVGFLAVGVVAVGGLAYAAYSFTRPRQAAAEDNEEDIIGAQLAEQIRANQE